MRATITIDEKLLKELLSVSKVKEDKDYSEAIKQALKEYVTWKKWERILTFGNRFEWDTDVLPRLEKFKLKRYRRHFTRKKGEKA